MYNGEKPSDPIHLNEYYQARESAAISCVQQIAVRLLSGPDTADVIANAAVSACDDQAVKQTKSLPNDGARSIDEVLAVVRTTMKRSALLTSQRFCQKPREPCR